jgi:PAS domain S-box-containing protein
LNKREAKDLRQQAERRLTGKEALLEGLDRNDLEKVAHELAVHQVELEMQNEDLRDSRREVEETRDRYLDLYDFAPVGYYTLDGHSRIEEANLTGCQILGIERQKLLKVTFTKFVNPQEADAFFLCRNRALKSGSRETCELAMLKADGTPFYARLESIKSGEERLRVALTDVTERAVLEQVVQFERDKMTRILSSMEDGVAIIAQDYEMQYANPSMQSQFGDAEGWKCYQYFNGRHDVCPWCNNRAVFGGEVLRVETVSNRTGRDYEVTEACLKNADGSSSKLAVWHDITERKKIDQLKDDFIGMVSHELKTPLTVIMGAVATAMDRRVPARKARELLGEAATYSDILANLVDNLLELSRHQSKRLVLDPRPTDVGEIVQRVIRRLKNRSSIHALVSDIPADLPETRADPFRVERIIFNLVDNAIKYSPNGGEVKIFAHREGDYVIVGVSDHGPGIPEGDRARLFRNFERLGMEVKGGIQGTGLGLSVCRILAEAHGGRIWVDSEEGNGSTFYFTIPEVKHDP